MRLNHNGITNQIQTHEPQRLAKKKDCIVPLRRIRVNPCMLKEFFVEEVRPYLPGGRPKENMRESLAHCNT